VAPRKPRRIGRRFLWPAQAAQQPVCRGEIVAPRKDQRDLQNSVIAGMNADEPKIRATFLPNVASASSVCAFSGRVFMHFYNMSISRPGSFHRTLVRDSGIRSFHPVKPKRTLSTPERVKHQQAQQPVHNPLSARAPDHRRPAYRTSTLSQTHSRLVRPGRSRQFSPQMVNRRNRSET
jgi:hypothetical protein